MAKKKRPPPSAIPQLAKFYGNQRKSSLLQSKKEPGVTELLEINSEAAEIGVPLRNTWHGPYPTTALNIVRGVPHFGCRCRHRR